MIRHFDQHLNVKALIEQFQPQLVVEAGCGLSTIKLLELRETMDFRLVCIDVVIDPDDPRKNLSLVPGELTEVDSPRWRKPLEFMLGVSYLNFMAFDNHSIEMAIVDTDHNGWTLEQELKVLAHKVKEGGIIILHDTEEFKDHNGVMDSYLSGEITYPRKAILAGPTMGQVVERYKQQWPVLAETTASCGAIAFQLRS